MPFQIEVSTPDAIALLILTLFLTLSLAPLLGVRKARSERRTPFRSRSRIVWVIATVFCTMTHAATRSL